MSIEFLLTSLIIVATPGTGVLYTLGIGLGRGARESILAAFSCTVGIVPHLTAALLGFAALLHTSAMLFSAVKYAGMLYLLYMAWQCLQGGGVLNVKEERNKASALKIFADGILINVLNPKLTIFFVAFLPQFLDPRDGAPLMAMAQLSGVFMLMTFLVFCGYGVFAAKVRRQVVNSPGILKWMQRGFAASFGLLAAKLAWTDK